MTKSDNAMTKNDKRINKNDNKMKNFAKNDKITKNDENDKEKLGYLKKYICLLRCSGSSLSTTFSHWASQCQAQNR